MWLSEARHRSDYESTEAAVCRVGANAGDTLRPAGIQRVPMEDETQLRLYCSDGSSVLLGGVGDEYPEGLAPGEIYIEAGNAAITVKNDGTVSINGAVKITGSLTLNGVSLH